MADCSGGRAPFVTECLRVPVLFMIAIFLAAALLFAVQPMVGRFVLPSMGGSPAVWNSVMLFFQAALLAGYAAAHLIARLPWRPVQAILHAGIAVGALFALPIGYESLAHTEAHPLAPSPVPMLLKHLAIGVGLPAFALATMSPILQRWYATLGLRRAHDPYFLYAASNAGSLVGLLGYPLLVEPTLGLTRQTEWWSIGFVAQAIILAPLWLGVLVKRRVPAAETTTEDRPERTPGSPLRWVILALVPSSLLLGVTQHITTDIAAAPLFWAVPLALYLITFIVAFGARAERVLAVSTRLAPILAVAVAVAYMIDAKHPLFVVLILHLAAFFVVALACHARLADSRPHPEHLTRFYLYVSIGGVLGGLVNALLAPQIFSWIAEYPIMIALGAGLAVGWPVIEKSALKDVAIGAVFAAAFVLMLFLFDGEGYTGAMFLVGLPALGAFILSARPLTFTLAIVSAMLLPMVVHPDRSLIHRERTFFGVHSVYVEPTENGVRHVLRHGSTIHGLQNVGSTTPQTYYHPTSPIGEVFRTLPPEARIGAIGLGVGSVASLAWPGDSITFFEIDPAVVRIAKDPALFTYLAESSADVKTVVGDGRLTIQAAQPMDLIILDAFTSDAIPTHLLTAEALALYESKLAPGGLIAIHLSNRYLELGPIVKATADEAGLAMKIHDDIPNSSELSAGKLPSVWAVLARDASHLAEFRRWATPKTDASVRPWTDDYASVLDAMRFD